MLKKRLLKILESVSDDAVIYFAVTGENVPFKYAHDVYADDIVNDEDKQNELTLVCHF